MPCGPCGACWCGGEDLKRRGNDSARLDVELCSVACWHDRIGYHAIGAPLPPAELTRFRELFSAAGRASGRVLARRGEFTASCCASTREC